MDRRTFLKIAGMGSIAFAAGCSAEPEKTLYSLVHAPDDMVTGQATWYASTCRECPAGCGILVKNREGRAVKLEGNPLHPVNQGALCMRGQAALQGLYNPDRLRTPMLRENRRWRAITFPEAEAILKEKAEMAAARGRNRIHFLTEVCGDSLIELFSATLRQWKSRGPVIFEPFAYESIRAANENIFGLDGLVSYRMEDADLMVSFGADFLETWLSPVEYAHKYNEMHRLKDGRKGFFCHVSPYQTLTGANSDQWLACNPGGETAVVLGLIREALAAGRGRELRTFIRSIIMRTADSYTPEKVAELSGISPEAQGKLKIRVLAAERPLVLGTGTGAPGQNDLLTNMAVNLLNAILDPTLRLFDFENRHRVETAARRSEVIEFFSKLSSGAADLAILHNVNPVFTLPPGSGVKKALANEALFTVCFSPFMDETAEMADLVFPVKMPLEVWDEYTGKTGFISMQQPAVGELTGAPHLGDVLLRAAHGESPPAPDYKAYMVDRLSRSNAFRNQEDWVRILQAGGVSKWVPQTESGWHIPYTAMDAFHALQPPLVEELVFIGVPALRFFDGRGANRPWLPEIPDPISKVAWQTPVFVHPATMAGQGFEQGEIVKIQSKQGSLDAPVYESECVRPNVLLMHIGQGHTAYGRYAEGIGASPVTIFPYQADPRSGGPHFSMYPVSLHGIGSSVELAHTDGSRIQHGRKIALRVGLEELARGMEPPTPGLTMNTFPLTLPLPEGYDPKRDFYPPHDHDGYRWAMVVDLDRCIGCSACSAACYAENNLGIVGEEQIVNGREMSWLRVERYHDPEQMEKIIFFPMMCQHCDNAPCESVCPVYAPHHSKEGLNNQVYNRCIGTRFCAQNCPYKVRRFNWFDWQWPDPLPQQLNPDVTVRSKGVMEKCSFCIQRIKAAHNVSKNEKRSIRDGEIVPACVQTCPTGALTFGNLMDLESRVRKLTEDPRAYQAMGYLNAKPAVIYLQKVTQEI